MYTWGKMKKREGETNVEEIMAGIRLSYKTG